MFSIYLSGLFVFIYYLTLDVALFVELYVCDPQNRGSLFTENKIKYHTGIRVNCIELITLPIFIDNRREMNFNVFKKHFSFPWLWMVWLEKTELALKELFCSKYSISVH